MKIIMVIISIVIGVGTYLFTIIMTSSEQNKCELKESYEKHIGEVINNDTIVDYSLENNTFILSNGKELEK